jgi:UDP-N-acetylmuramyl pentapeptide phosphotransferase/UDP-N-acetylglucosamine-1-phosphate transferase
MTGNGMDLRTWLAAGAFVSAAALSVALIVLLSPLLRRYAMVRPNPRSSHQEPTPQGGGLAVVAATIVVTLAGAAMLSDASSPVAQEILAVLVATVLIAAVGGADDLRPLPVIPRLMLQTFAVAVALAAIPGDLRIVPMLPWWIERTCLLAGLLWFVNLVNFMDGIDWMTVAEVVPLTATLGLLGLWGTIPALPAVLAFALLGAVLGFAPFNKPVAKLFLGDVGSLPVGFLLGWLLLQSAAAGEIAAAILLPLYYAADATLTLLRRIAAREPFWQSHRSHFYQRACDMGFTVPAIIGRVFAINLMLCGLGLLTVVTHDGLVRASALVIGAGLVAWLLLSFSRKRASLV